MPKAMNLTFGDLIFIEIALVHYIQNLDLSMQCGQFVTELVGKVEYQMAEIKQIGGAAITRELQPAEEIKPDPIKP